MHNPLIPPLIHEINLQYFGRGRTFSPPSCGRDHITLFVGCGHTERFSDQISFIRPQGLVVYSGLIFPVHLILRLIDLFLLVLSLAHSPLFCVSGFITTTYSPPRPSFKELATGRDENSIHIESQRHQQGSQSPQSLKENKVAVLSKRASREGAAQQNLSHHQHTCGVHLHS